MKKLATEHLLVSAQQNNRFWVVFCIRGTNRVRCPWYASNITQAVILCSRLSTFKGGLATPPWHAVRKQRDETPSGNRQKSNEYSKKSGQTPRSLPFHFANTYSCTHNYCMLGYPHVRIPLEIGSVALPKPSRGRECENVQDIVIDLLNI